MFIIVVTWLVLAVLGIAIGGGITYGFNEGWTREDVMTFCLLLTVFSLLLYYRLQ